MEKLNPKKTMWLSLIPGLGQLKNGQKAKGIIFLGIFALFIIEMAVFGFNALVGLVTRDGCRKRSFDVLDGSRNAAIFNHDYLFDVLCCKC